MNCPRVRTLATVAAQVIASAAARAELPDWVKRRPAALGDSAPRVTVREGHALLCWAEHDPRDGRRYWALVKVPLAGDVPLPVTAADAALCEHE
jgi:hypothetical protein